MLVDCGAYDDAGHRLGGTCPPAEAVARVEEAGAGFVWVGLVEPTPEELAPVAAALGLHPLAVEDAVHAQQRPKLDRFGDDLFLVLRTVHYVDHQEIVEAGEILVFVGARHVVTVRHGPVELTAVRHALEAQPATLAAGPVAVLYAIADHVVDGYEASVRAVEEDVDEVQVAVFDEAGTSHSRRIFLLKREVLQFRQAVLPLRGPLGDLAGGSVRLVPDGLRPYLRDVLDHLFRVADDLDRLDGVLTSALDANIAQVGIRQNEDMRKMSAWVAIGVVPTVVAGLYGMNFEHMPELQLRYGYPAVLVAILVICLSLYRTFKRRGWL